MTLQIIVVMFLCISSCSVV